MVIDKNGRGKKHAVQTNSFQQKFRKRGKRIKTKNKRWIPRIAICVSKRGNCLQYLPWIVDGAVATDWNILHGSTVRNTGCTARAVRAIRQIRLLLRLVRVHRRLIVRTVRICGRRIVRAVRHLCVGVVRIAVRLWRHTRLLIHRSGRLVGVRLVVTTRTIARHRCRVDGGGVGVMFRLCKLFESWKRERVYEWLFFFENRMWR